MTEYELLEARPAPERPSRLRLVAALGLLLACVLVLREGLRDDDLPPSDCRQQRGTAWCTTPTEILTDPSITRLVRGYCPRLRSLPLEDVVPQPLTEVGDLPARADELVLTTGGPGARVESGLLGRPGRLAWVVHRVSRGGPWRLQVICHEDTDRVPALELDAGQLRSTVRADAGGRGLDLRLASRTTAHAVRRTPQARLSLGTFRCGTRPSALDLRAGARFRCSLELFSDQGQALHRVTYRVHSRPPYLRAVA